MGRSRSPALAAAIVVVLAVALAAVPGCGEPGVHDDHAGHDHGVRDTGAEPAAHQHAAPHGGTLVALEAEVFNVELLLDPATGTLTAWTLDGHCEHPVRIVQDAIELTLDLSGTAVAVRLDAVANPLTGETKGDTSEFRGSHDGLRGAGDFSGTIRSVRVGPRAFQDVKFRYARKPL